MDGENNGSKPYEQMDDLGGLPPLFLIQHPNIKRTTFDSIAELWIFRKVLGDAKVSHRPELSDLWCDQILERVLKEVSSLGWDAQLS